MRFFTAINCMDGRVQLPVIKYLQKRFNIEYVDSITEAGPNLILAEMQDTSNVKSILKRLKISVEKHDSMGIAIIGHADCAGNPVADDIQKIHIKKSLGFIRQQYEKMEVIGLWVDQNWKVHEVKSD